MILFALGPFGLPLVWRSPALGRRERWGWTAAVLALTALLALGLRRAWLQFTEVLHAL